MFTDIWSFHYLQFIIGLVLLKSSISEIVCIVWSSGFSRSYIGLWRTKPDLSMNK